MKFNKMTVLAKIESSYKSDSNPTGSANAILASDINISALEADSVTRENPRAELGAYAQIHVGSHQKISFKVEAAGAGNAGDVPAWGVLERMCGMSEMVTSLTSVVYEPVSDSEESGSIYFNIDGQLHQLIGARGSRTVEINTKGLAFHSYEFTGLWVDPATVSAPTVDFSGFKTPLEVSNANSPTFTLFGQSMIMQSLQINGGNTVIHRDLVGIEEVVITERAASAALVVEAVPLSTFNIFTVAKANGLDAMLFVHGTAGGNIIEYAAPKTQILSRSYSDQDGIAMWTFDLSLTPNTGDDDYTITVK